MKNILTVLALCGMLFSQSCTSNNDRPENKTSVDQVDPGERSSSNINDGGLDANSDNTTSSDMAYICPMKCEGSASNTPGKCPVCKMDLVKNANYVGNGDNKVLNHEPAEATGQSQGKDDQLEGQPK